MFYKEKKKRIILQRQVSSYEIFIEKFHLRIRIVLTTCQRKALASAMHLRSYQIFHRCKVFHFHRISYFSCSWDRLLSCQLMHCHFTALKNFIRNHVPRPACLRTPNRFFYEEMCTITC